MADLGDRLDELEVRPTLLDGDLVVDAVVLLRVVDADGIERLQAAWSSGISWVTRLGMLHHAIHNETQPPGEPS